MEFNDLYATLRIFFLFSIPEAIINIWFSLVWLGMKPNHYFRRIALFGVLMSVLVDIALLTFPKWLYAIYSILNFFIVIHIVFPKFKWKLRLLMFVITYSIGFIIESLCTFISSYLDGYNSIIHGTVGEQIAIFWPPLILVAALTAYMQKKQLAPAKKLREFLIHPKNKWYLLLVILICLQAYLLMILINGIFIKPESLRTIKILLFALLLLFIAVSLLVFVLIARARSEAIRSTQETYIGDLLKMFATIRGQRHDFVNHVQVMYSMLTMKKYDQLRSYLEQVVSEIQTINKLVEDMPSPALAALVQAKMAVAYDKRIAFVYKFHETQATFGVVSDIDLVRMIGNLVDNAFDEVMKIPEGEREVELDLYTEGGMLYISVTNRGNMLTENDIARMFEPGYTTKSGEHSGLGLANVRERAAHYGGTVTARYDEERGIAITVKLPAKNPSKNKPA